MMLQARILFILFLTAGMIYVPLSIFSSSLYIMPIALLLLSLQLAKLFITFIWSYLPSEILPDITEKTVFITGCDTGFGNKLARQLDSKGLKVFAGCLFADGPGASKLKEDCSKNLHILQLDVTKDDQVNEAVKYVTNVLNDKPLHAVVNNAGVFSASEVEFIEIEELKRVLEINTIGVARVTQAFLPLLRKSKGRIVFTASISSTEEIPFLGAYSMSKSALLSYANTVRREVMRWSISVHTIEPILYGTEIKNKELIVSRIDSGFYHAPEETRRAYGGEDYRKAYTTGYDYFDLVESNRIEEVTDCMTDAVIAKYPKLRYHPGFLGKVIFWILTNFPQECNDIFHYYFIKYAVGKFNESGKKKQ